MSRRRAVPAAALMAAAAAAIGMADGPVAMPVGVRRVLADRCSGCHSGSEAEGGVRLDVTQVDWDAPGAVTLWSRVMEAVERRRMPPADETPLTTAERDSLRDGLDPPLLARIPCGGTPPRRLGRAEYEATIRRLLRLPDYHLPPGFPPDTERHGFDNLAEGLVLSPAHLEAYAAAAHEVADEIFPPPRPLPKRVRLEAGPRDLALSFSAATIHGDALRLVSRSETIMRSCTWPSRIEIKDSGTYMVAVTASQFLSPAGHGFEGPMKLEVYARPVAATDRSSVSSFRLLRTIDVDDAEPRSTSFAADLYEGETVLFRWANAEMTHEYEELADQMEAWFRDDPRFLAAWQRAVFPAGVGKGPQAGRLRGRNGWDIVSKHWADPALDMSEATMDSPTTKKLLAIWRSMTSTTALADGLCHFYHDRGPALELHGVVIEGPVKLVESPRDRARAVARQAVLGPQPAGGAAVETVRAMLTSFLPQAFRRPVDDATLADFESIAMRHLDAGHSLDQAMHLLLRSSLVSPRFLYRCIEPVGPEGGLDQFDLAARLSYFLSQGPPDEKLVDLATRGRLGESWVLRREAQRLMPLKPTDPLIRSFVGQWLDTRLLPGIMPDPKFRFDDEATAVARRETEAFVSEILARNLPMETFVDPDFTFSTIDFCRRNYGFTPAAEAALSAAEIKRFQRLPIDRGGRYGGLLGQSAILMATANGVDTQPVIRGVWVLENLLGMPPPPPPKNVPALTPDTRGARTPRDLLAAHTREANCAVCHARIDPIGFVLENYDPVGRWRTTWPGTEAEIDASGRLPDGTVVRGPAEFKAWLVANIDLFSQCLAEKLLTYATGRVPNYAERHEIGRIVRANREAGAGFQDLVLDLIDSRTFRAR